MILVLVMLFLLPVVSPDIYVNEQWRHENQLRIITSIYDNRKSWEAYRIVFDDIMKDG